MNQATDKQKNYLSYILNNEGIKLSDYTEKNIDELIHKDIVNILNRLNSPITPMLKNLKYIIKEDFGEYLVGKQINTKLNTEMDLICFKDLLIVDWDDTNNNKREFLEQIKNNLRVIPHTFYIYETFNGFHGYLVSKRFLYSEWNTIRLLQEIKCDPFYIGFTSPFCYCLYRPNLLS